MKPGAYSIKLAGSGHIFPVNRDHYVRNLQSNVYKLWRNKFYEIGP